MLITTKSIAQLSPINFETGGYGATWTWTTFENATNLPTQIVANPNASGINTSANVIKKIISHYQGVLKKTISKK